MDADDPMNDPSRPATTTPDSECGWCLGTGTHHYNTDDMDRLTMPCPNRDCPRSPDWWHAETRRARNGAAPARHEYDSRVPQVEWLSAPSPLRSELIAAFNVLISRIERLEANRADA